MRQEKRNTSDSESTGRRDHRQDNRIANYAATIIHLLQWFASLDNRARGNLIITAVMGFAGVMIWTKPESVGPWFQAMLHAADIKTWSIITLGLFAFYNMMAREYRLEEHVKSLQDRIQAMEDELDRRDRNHALELAEAKADSDRRLKEARTEFDSTIERVVAQREQYRKEISLFRTSITKLFVLAADAGSGAEAKEVIRELDAGLAKVQE